MGVSSSSSNMNSKLLFALAVLGCLSLASAGNRYNNYDSNYGSSRYNNGRTFPSRNNNRYNDGRNGRNNRYNNRENCETTARYNKPSFIRRYGSSIYHKCWYGGTYTAGNARITCSTRNGRGYLINVRICTGGRY